MSFRKKKNAHEIWVAYRDKMSDLFMIFVDDLDSVNQKNFEEYLTEGINEHFHTPVTQLSNQDFLSLEEIVDGWDSHDYGFDVYFSEKVKRFNHYG